MFFFFYKSVFFEERDKYIWLILGKSRDIFTVQTIDISIY